MKKITLCRWFLFLIVILLSGSFCGTVRSQSDETERIRELYKEQLSETSDPVLRLEIIRRAADSGLEEAQVQMAYAYMGFWVGKEAGLEPSDEMAEYYFMLAAAHGNADTIADIADKYAFEGLLTENDHYIEMAEKYYRLAIGLGYEGNPVIDIPDAGSEDVNENTISPDMDPIPPVQDPMREVSPAEEPSGTSPMVQDFYYYAGDEMDVSDAHVSQTGKGAWAGSVSESFKGGPEDMELIRNYVKYLDREDFPFRLDHEYEGSSKKLDTYSAVLVYTGDTTGIGERLELQYDGNYSGHVMIYYSCEGSRLKGQIFLSKGMEFSDFGLRPDGSIAKQERGESSAAGLLEKGNGIYATDDGRLETSVNQAMILRDGVPYTTGEVSMYRNREKSKDEIRIYNFYRNEGIAMTFPEKALMTGDELTQKQIGVDIKGVDSNVWEMEDFFRWRPPYKFGVCHNGDYLFAHIYPENDLEQVLVRVLKWDEEHDIGVLYIFCGFATEPYTLEVLAAVQISGTSPESEARTGYTVRSGDSIEITFDEKNVYMPNYETYVWEILEGSRYVELSGTHSKTCRVRGTAAGTAILRVTYEYGVDEPDVLTGNLHNVNKTYVKEIEIVVE